jgi:hypothetical protein
MGLSDKCDVNVVVMVSMQYLHNIICKFKVCCFIFYRRSQTREHCYMSEHFLKCIRNYPVCLSFVNATEYSCYLVSSVSIIACIFFLHFYSFSLGFRSAIQELL